MTEGVPHGLARQQSRGRERGTRVGSLLLQTRPVTGLPAQLALAGYGREGLTTKGRGGGDRGTGSFHTEAGSQKRKQVETQERSRGGFLGCGVGVQSSAQCGEASPTCGQEASEVLGTEKFSVRRQEVPPLPCGLFSEKVGCGV